jgi:importin subunit alpha-6/7
MSSRTLQDHQSKLSERKKDFQKGIDATETRRRREEQSLAIRKSKREEMMAKKRQIANRSDNLVDVASQNEIRELVNTIHSPDPNVRLNAVVQIRKLLSSENSPPISEVIETGAVPHFITFLDRAEEPKLQFESAWVLTNIASGTSEQTHLVVHKGAVPAFVRLLSSPNDDLREQAAWALGNIAGDSPHFRDLVLQAGALEPLLHCLTNSHKIGMLRNCSWTLSNFCRGKPPPPFHFLEPAVGVLSALLSAPDDEILTDVCWALSYLTDGTNDRIQAVVRQPGLVNRVVELLDHETPSVQTPALRVVGNIVTGDEAQTQTVLNCPLALPYLKKLLLDSNKAIRKEACWGISNITAGTTDQIQMVISADIIPIVVELMKSAEFEIRKEAAWTLSNASSCGSSDQVLYLANQNVIPLFCEFLSCLDQATVSICLDGLENILKLGNDTERFGSPNPFVRVIEECNGLEQLNGLINHQNPGIYEKVAVILDYFENADDVDDDLQPSVNQNQFGFGADENNFKGGFNFG